MRKKDYFNLPKLLPVRIKYFAPVLALIAMLCCSLKCRKDKDKPPVTLPPITQEGKNTFGCKVNGEVWVPYVKCGFGSNPCGELAVNAYKTDPTASLPLSISFVISKRDNNNLLSYFSIETEGNSGINTTGNKIDSFALRFIKSGSHEYREIPGMGLNNSFLVTNLDTINKIFSGRFETTLYRSFTDSVKITEGRFDLKFQACRCSN